MGGTCQARRHLPENDNGPIRDIPEEGKYFRVITQCKLVIRSDLWLSVDSKNHVDGFFRYFHHGICKMSTFAGAYSVN